VVRPRCWERKCLAVGPVVVVVAVVVVVVAVVVAAAVGPEAAHDHDHDPDVHRREELTSRPRVEDGRLVPRD